MTNLIELTKQTGKQNVISFGLNMNCKRVITKSELLYNNLTGEFYIKNGGILITANENDLDDLLLDTKENRKFLSLTK